MECRFTGLMDAWKEDLINDRVRRMGFRGQDADDAAQELAIKVWEFTFDPDRANGQTEQTVLTCLFDRTLKAKRRKDARYRKHLAGFQDETGRDGAGHPAEPQEYCPVEESPEMDEALASLSQRQQAVCDCLARGLSQRQTAKELGLDRRTVASDVEAIRRKFEALGLKPRWGDEDQRAIA